MAALWWDRGAWSWPAGNNPNPLPGRALYQSLGESPAGLYETGIPGDPLLHVAGRPVGPPSCAALGSKGSPLRGPFSRSLLNLPTHRYPHDAKVGELHIVALQPHFPGLDFRNPATSEWALQDQGRQRVVRMVTIVAELATDLIWLDFVPAESLCTTAVIKQRRSEKSLTGLSRLKTVENYTIRE